MNRFDKQLIAVARQNFPLGTEPVELLRWLIDEGVVDNPVARRLAVRSYVAHLVGSGKCGKVDALYRAADHFGCSYHTARNYVYQ